MEKENNKSKVYFSESIDKILEKIDFSSLYGRIGIKTHFGEKGCVTYINPEIVKSVYDNLVSLGKEASLIECNVLYKGSRTKTKDHKSIAKKHGFDFAPIDILDTVGESGKNEDIELDVPSGGKVKKAKIGKGIENYDSLIVLSHYKGHIAAGTGGSFKNLGMGLGSRAGKLHMHSDVSPTIDKEKCIACGKCIENCNFDAISFVENKNSKKEKKAEINPDKCVGCAMCIAVCPEKAVSIPWGGSSNEDLQRKIVDYSNAIINYLNKNSNKTKIKYINVLQNITPNCDCDGSEQKPIMDDIGILASDDPVAIDKASFDLVQKNSDGKFDNVNSVDKSVQTDYSEKRGLGSKDYEIIDLDKE